MVLALEFCLPLFVRGGGKVEKSMPFLDRLCGFRWCPERPEPRTTANYPPNPYLTPMQITDVHMITEEELVHGAGASSLTMEMRHLSISLTALKRVYSMNIARYVRALSAVRYTVIGSSCLLLAAFTGIKAQVLSTAPLGIPGAEVQENLTIADGSTLTVGKLNDVLHLVQWSAEGDTLRTRSVPVQIPVIRSLVPLPTGGILVSGYYDAHLFDADLQPLGPSGLSGSHVIGFGRDSLLQAKGDSLFMRAADGGIIWQQRVVQRDPHLPFRDQHHLLARIIGGFSLFSMYMDDHSSVYVGRYSADGDFVDTVRVNIDQSSPIVASHAVAATNDGGSLFVGVYATGCPLMVRISADGNILWTRHLPFYEWSSAAFEPRDVVELPDGGFAMSGHRYEWEGLSVELLTVDDHGVPRCRLLLGPQPTSEDVFPFHSSAIELRSDGHFNVYYSGYSPGQLQQVFRSVVGDPCLSTGEEASTTDPPFAVWPTVTHGWVNIRRADVPGPYFVTLMDPAGRSVFRGQTSSDGGLSLQHQAPGVYLMRVEGSSVLQRILLH